MNKTTTAIKAKDLELVLVAAKMRRYNKGRTCQLAVFTAAPIIRADCSSRNRLAMREESQRSALKASLVSPLDRGHIGNLFERVKCWHGRPEVFKTWGAGIRALQAEPRFVLNGGAA